MPDGCHSRYCLASSLWTLTCRHLAEEPLQITSDQLLALICEMLSALPNLIPKPVSVILNAQLNASGICSLLALLAEPLQGQFMCQQCRLQWLAADIPSVGWLQCSWSIDISRSVNRPYRLLMSMCCIFVHDGLFCMAWARHGLAQKICCKLAICFAPLAS